MKHELTPLGDSTGPALPAPARGITAVPPPESEPPAALQAEYQAAAKVIEELAAQQVNLHFELDDDSNRVHVQVLDGDGEVIRDIPARSLLDMLGGGVY